MMKHKISVAIVGLDFFGRGAVSIGARQQTIALLEAGFSVVAITDKLDGADAWKEGLSWGHRFTYLRVWSADPPRIGMAGKEISFAIGCLLKFRSILRHYKIVSIVSQISGPIPVVIYLTRRMKVPIVFVVRALMQDQLKTGDSPHNLITTWFYRLSNFLAVRQADACISVSHYIRKAIIDLGAVPERSHVLHNGVDTDLFSPLSNIKQDTDVLYVGRFSREKGIMDLIEATNYLSRRIRVKIIGDGVLRYDVEKAAADSAMDIVIRRWVDNPSLPRLMCASRILVVPSRSEAFPRVVLEGMACGQPVLGSNVGGIPEIIINGRNGILVEPGNPFALAKAIENALADEEWLKKAGLEARRTAERFSLVAHDANFIDLMRKIVSKSRMRAKEDSTSNTGKIWD